MNKRLIRLTESDLHRIVKESVKKVLKESIMDEFGKRFDEITSSEVGGDDVLFKKFSELYPNLSELFNQLYTLFNEIKAYDFSVNIGEPFVNCDKNEFFADTPFLHHSADTITRKEIIDKISSVVKQYGKGICQFVPYSNAHINLRFPSTVDFSDLYS